eukprot:scaffold229620_cov24-Tisochrysis_lutea.AAC.1
MSTACACCSAPGASWNSMAMLRVRLRAVPQHDSAQGSFGVALWQPRQWRFEGNQTSLGADNL